MRAPDRSTVRWATALVFLASLFYFLLFHRYGFFLQDEGVIAWQALRVQHGQLPYRDFQTAYPPAAFYIHAGLFALFDPGLPLLRVVASFLCAITAALLFLAAIEVLPAPYAFLPSLLYVVLEDQESRGFVVHTIAYPARYVTLLWVLGLLLTLAYARTRRRLLVVALGLVTAGVLSLKHTAGIYHVWAIGASLVLIAVRSGAPPVERSARPRATLVEILPLAFLLAILVALPVLFGAFTGLSIPIFIAFWVPVGLAALLLVPHVMPSGGDPATLPIRRAAGGRAGADLAWFGATALIPTVAWIVYFAAKVSPGTLIQRLVLDGRLVARSYAIAFPAPGPLAILAAVFVMVALGGRILCGRGLLDRAEAARALVAAGGAIFVAMLAGSVALVRDTLRMNEWELGIMHVGRQLDNLVFYVTPIVTYAFLPALRAARPRDEPELPVLLCWLQAVFQLLLAYPRIDVAHLYEGTVLLLVPATVLLHRTLRFFQVGSGRRWLPAAAAATLTVVIAVKMVPRVRAQLGWEEGPIVQRRMPLRGARGGLYLTGPDGGWVDALNRTVGLVTRLTDPGTPIFGYPALSAVYFLADRRNPTAYDYFYSGFGEGHDELAIVTELEERQVPLVITVQDETYDQGDRGYFPILKDYLRRHFRQARSFPPFSVLERVLP